MNKALALLESLTINITMNPPQTFGHQAFDMTKVEAIIAICEASQQAVSAADEIQNFGSIDTTSDREYLKELESRYAKAQVDIQMGINAIRYEEAA